ncbi:MAG TPA: hypothetical protein GXZ91_02250 [Christensenellaceae bacterium]|jgi:hypothetical protein|nr:hypothetical protein [Christensenellaceae bacterium]
MNNMDIQFYGERGIINGILLDIYRDKNKDKKLNNFFGTIKLFDGKEVPWKDGITNCKWMVEPSFAHFGNPDLIAVFESGRKKYAVFIEAKLKDYVSSCLSFEREDGVDNLKGQSSKLNVQLSFRYRFVQAFKKAQKESSQAIIEPCHKHPDGRRRKLQKESVVESVVDFLEGVDEYYFIALTNDSSSETVIEEMSSNFFPPLNDFDKQYFGILTYGELVKKMLLSISQKPRKNWAFLTKHVI